MGKLFGTDGIRGIANQYPITSEMAVNIGKASAYLFKKENEPSSMVVGKDTRLSGDMLAHGLISGICSMGVDAYLVGTFPTPGIAYLTVSSRSIGGIMISASHNPYDDNGIKFFNQHGRKLSRPIEDEIERLLYGDAFDVISSKIAETGRVFSIDDAGHQYQTFLKQAISNEFSLNGMKIVMDCANGATYKIAPELFTDLGASVKPLFVKPNGKNINYHCGSQHPGKVIKAVVASGADIGLAFDGDGDRLIAVDETGNVITGDQILFVCAKVMKHQGILKNNLAVSSVMSNLGLRIALQNLGIHHVMVDVGDRHIMEKMMESGAVLGGEDSGHTIFLNHHTTGDGILTALKLIEAMQYESKPLSELAGIVTVFPQVLINVNVKNQPDLQSDPSIQKAVKSVEEKLGEKGRVLVRYSGTRPLCRIMVEGPTEDQTRAFARMIADVVSETLG